MAEAKKAKKDEGSLAARAWNATKAEGDPEFDVMPNVELKAKLEHAAERVKATGIAQTNFEIEVKKLAATELEENKSEGPMAVVAPNVATDSAPNAVASEAAQLEAKGVKAPTTKAKALAKKSSVKKSASKAAAKKTDKSGHVPTAKEKAAIAAAEKDAPIRP